MMVDLLSPVDSEAVSLAVGGRARMLPVMCTCMIGVYTRAVVHILCLDCKPWDKIGNLGETSLPAYSLVLSLSLSLFLYAPGSFRRKKLFSRICVFTTRFIFYAEIPMESLFEIRHSRSEDSWSSWKIIHGRATNRCYIMISARSIECR